MMKDSLVSLFEQRNFKTLHIFFGKNIIMQAKGNASKKQKLILDYTLCI